MRTTFDLETTGVDPYKDRIVQFAITSIDKDGNEHGETMLINPEMPISEGASAVTGIYDADVRESKTFKQVAQRIYDQFFKNAEYICGYNILAFDLIILQREFDRAGIEFDYQREQVYDAYFVHKKFFGNSLSGVYRLVTGTELIGAHDAMADVSATDVVMDHQTKVIDKNFDSIIKETYKDLIDLERRFVYNEDGEPVFNFGKHKGKIVYKEKDYLKWMLSSEFSVDTMKYCAKFLEDLHMSVLNQALNKR